MAKSWRSCMESVNRKIIVISIVLALFTAFLVYLYIKNSTTKNEVVEYINVYVAAKTLPAKYKITDADLKQVKVTKEYLNSKAVLNKADIVGKRLKDSVIEGEQILRDRLIGESRLALAYSIPEGKRAVSINVNDQTDVSHLIRPGDFVDIIASFEKEDVEDAFNKTIFPRITRTIIQNVEVLALGQDQAIADEKIKEPPGTVTLAVSAEEAESLVYASEYAVIRLALRPVDDNGETNTKGIMRNDLTPGKGVLVVPK